MTTQHDELPQAACALAYFEGFARAEVVRAAERATVRQVVEAFARAVGAGRVNRAAYKAFQSGWRAGEAMACQ